jgi:hypothetical protein
MNITLRLLMTFLTSPRFTFLKNKRDAVKAIKDFTKFIQT